jgi:hypothetical protein
MQAWGVGESIWSALVIMAAVLMWASQVGPKQVVSHAAEWVCAFGIKNPPGWLKSENADRAVRHVAAIVILIWFAGLVFVFDIGAFQVGQKLLIAFGCLTILVAIVWRLISPPGPVAEAANKSTKLAPPAVVLLPGRDRLLFENKGSTEIYLWGSGTDNETPPIEMNARIVPVGHHYYFLTDTLEARARAALGANGERLVPFSVYLSDSEGRRYTAKFGVLVIIRDSEITFHTQQLGFSEGGWTPRESDASNADKRRVAEYQASIKVPIIDEAIAILNHNQIFEQPIDDAGRFLDSIVPELKAGRRDQLIMKLDELRSRFVANNQRIGAIYVKTEGIHDDISSILNQPYSTALYDGIHELKSALAALESPIPANVDYWLKPQIEKYKVGIHAVGRWRGTALFALFDLRKKLTT